MNDKQRKIVLVAAIVIGIMCAFPPWVFRMSDRGMEVTKEGGWSPIFLKAPYMSRLSVERLGTQVICVVMLALGAFLWAGKKRE